MRTASIFVLTFFALAASAFAQPDIVARAQTEQRAGRADECIKLATQALTANPGDATALGTRGACYATKLQADSKAAPFGKAPVRTNGELALKDYNALIAAQPTNLNAQYYRAAVYFLLTDFETSADGLKAVLAADASHKPSQDLLRSVNVQLASKAFQAAADKEQAAEKAAGAEREKLLRESLELFTRSIEISPPDCLDWSARARIYTLLGEHSAAIKDHNACIAADGKDDILNYWLLGKAYAANGDYDQAIKTNEKGLAILNTRSDVAHQKSDFNVESGNTMMLKGDAKAAIKYYDLAITDSPRYAHAYVLRGKAKLKNGDRAGAEADYKKALEITPGQVDAVKALAELSAAKQ